MGIAATSRLYTTFDEPCCQYRVIAIKERSVDVMYRDEVQVAVRAKAKQE